MRHFVLGTLLIFILLGCNQKDAHLDTVFHYNQPNNITSLDPAFARSMNNIWAVHHLYSKLVKLDPEMNVVGDIAKNWTIRDSGRTYVFHLKSNVFFHDHDIWEGPSRKVTAVDVAYSFQRIIDPQVSSPGSWIFQGKLDDIEPFSVQNDSTFILRLKKPFAPMLSILTMEYCSIVPEEVSKIPDDEFRRNPIGSGPYKFLKWRENQGLFLRKNEKYELWNSDLPLNDGVRVSFIRDRKTALLELLQGNVDYLSGYDVTYKALVLNDELEVQKRHRDQIRLNKSPFLNTEYFGIQQQKAKEENSPLADVNFRKALNFGIDRSLMIKALNGGIGQPAHHGFIPIGLPSFPKVSNGYEFNIDSCKKYLELSEYKGEKIELLTNKDYLEKCLFASKMWEDVGIRVKVNLVESSMLRDMMRKGEALFFRASWIADYPDGESFLTVFYGKNPAPPNYTRFVNDDFDEHYENSLLATDDSIKVDLYRRADQVLIDKCPVIFLYYDETFGLSHQRVNEIQTNALNLLECELVEFK